MPAAIRAFVVNEHEPRSTRRTNGAAAVQSGWDGYVLHPCKKKDKLAVSLWKLHAQSAGRTLQKRLPFAQARQGRDDRHIFYWDKRHTVSVSFGVA